MTEGANRAFLRQNPLIEKEFIKRLKRGDTTIELAEYLKNTKWPGSTESGSVSAFIQNTFPKENKQLLLDVGYTEGEVNKMTPAKKTGLKSKIKSYKNVLIPHLKKYDGTVESIALSNVRDQKNLDYLFNNSFKNENDPKILKFIQKDIKKNPKIIQNQIKKFISSGSSDKARVARSITTSALKKQPIRS